MQTLSIRGMDWAMLTGLSVLWGLSFIFMELALEELPVFHVAFFRVLIAALALNVIIAARGWNLGQFKAHWPAFAVMGIVGIAVPFSLIIWGQVYITAGLSAILNGTLPFFTLIVAHFFTTDEKMTLRRVTALVFGFVGVMIIIGPGALKDIVDTGKILGQLAVLLATFCYGLVTVYGRRFSRLEVPRLVAATGQMSVASAVLLPFMLWEMPWAQPMPGGVTISALLGVGLLSTALAFTIWYYLLERVGANNLSLVTFMIPIVTIIVGYYVLGEVLTASQIFGMLVVAVGLIVADGRLWWRFFPKRIM